MKRKDIKKCLLCGKGVLNGGNMHFYRIRMDSMLINQRGVQEQAGLEMQIGTQLAEIMGTNPDIANEISSENAFICANCYMAKPLICLAELHEIMGQQNK